jgi:hypothetical protein
MARGMLSPFPRDNQGDDVSRPSCCKHGLPRDKWFIVSTCTDIGPRHYHISQVHHEGIHHIIFLLRGIGSCSMRYMLGIMVSVISIFEAIEFVSFKIAFDYVMFAWKLCYLPCFTLVVDIAP